MARQERKSEPFSIRLSAATDRLVEAEAKRTRRSKGAIVEAFTEEAARVRRFPGIGFHGDDAARAPWVIGTGLDVWEVVELLDDYGSMERLVRDTQLTPAHVRIALAYREAYPDEIDDALAANRRAADEWRSLFPFVQTAS
ncbi:MAG: DUF433 domain-containing protein [Actinomycetota bacterium]